MSFARLDRGQALAFAAALALILSTAIDWYTTDRGEEARRIERIQPEPTGAESGEVPRAVLEDARVTAEGQEKNAWQASAFIDRLILLGVLATAVSALATGFMAAAADPRAAAAITAAGSAALVTAVLTLVRFLEPPGVNAGVQIEVGAPLALLALAAVAAGSGLSRRAT